MKYNLIARLTVELGLKTNFIGLNIKNLIYHRVNKKKMSIKTPSP